MPSQEDDEPRAAQLVPAEDPHPDPAPKRIAERRAAGWRLSSRLVARNERRPAGNSRAFWRRIEEDDPFLPSHAPPRVREDHVLYPAERLPRVPAGWTPPEAPRPAAPAPQRAAPPSRPATDESDLPERVRPPPARPAQPAPERSAPSPTDGRGPANAGPPASQVPPSERRLPPRAPDPVVGSRARTGRIPVSRGGAPGQPVVIGKDGRTASEIRAEKEQARKEVGPAPPPELRKLDSVLGIFGELAAAQEQFERDQAEKERAKREGRAPEVPEAAPRVERARPPASPAPPSAGPAAPPERAAALDDLVGGGPQEGRVRIPRRARKPEAGPE